jgi:hypothetical protein
MFGEIVALDDGPEELSKKLPIKIQFLKPLSNADGSDYALAALEKALVYKSQRIDLLIVGARFEGSRIGHGMEDFPINIAVVTDNSIIDDDVLDFSKGEYVAIGFCNEIESFINA